MSESPNRKLAGARLKDERVRLGVSQRALGDVAGVPYPTISWYERAFSGQFLPANVAEKFAAAFRSLGSSNARIAYVLGSAEAEPDGVEEDMQLLPRVLKPVERDVIRELIAKWRDNRDYEARNALEQRFALLIRRVIAQLKNDATQLAANASHLSEADWTGEARIGFLEAINTGEVSSHKPVEQVIEEHVFKRILRLLAAQQLTRGSGLRAWSATLLQNISAFEQLPPVHIGGRPIVAYATKVERGHCRIDVGAPFNWYGRPPALERSRAVYAIKVDEKLGSRVYENDELMLLDAGFSKPERLVGREALLTWEVERNTMASACANLVSMNDARLTAQFFDGARTFSRSEVAIHRILKVADLVT